MDPFVAGTASGKSSAFEIINAVSPEGFLQAQMTMRGALPKMKTTASYSPFAIPALAIQTLRSAVYHEIIADVPAVLAGLRPHSGRAFQRVMSTPLDDIFELCNDKKQRLALKKKYTPAQFKDWANQAKHSLLMVDILEMITLSNLGYFFEHVDQALVNTRLLHKEVNERTDCAALVTEDGEVLNAFFSEKAQQELVASSTGAILPWNIDHPWMRYVAGVLLLHATADEADMAWSGVTYDTRFWLTGKFVARCVSLTGAPRIINGATLFYSFEASAMSPILCISDLKLGNFQVRVASTGDGEGESSEPESRATSTSDKRAGAGLDASIALTAGDGDDGEDDDGALAASIAALIDSQESGALDTSLYQELKDYLKTNKVATTKSRLVFVDGYSTERTSHGGIHTIRYWTATAFGAVANILLRTTFPIVDSLNGIRMSQLYDEDKGTFERNTKGDFEFALAQTSDCAGLGSIVPLMNPDALADGAFNWQGNSDGIPLAARLCERLKPECVDASTTRRSARVLASVIEARKGGHAEEYAQYRDLGCIYIPTRSDPRREAVAFPLSDERGVVHAPGFDTSIFRSNPYLSELFKELGVEMSEELAANFASILAWPSDVVTIALDFKTDTKMQDGWPRGEPVPVDSLMESGFAPMDFIDTNGVNQNFIKQRTKRVKTEEEITVTTRRESAAMYLK